MHDMLPENLPVPGPGFYDLMQSRYPGWILGVVQRDHIRGLLHALDLMAGDSQDAAAAGCSLAWWTVGRELFDRDFLNRFAAFNAARPFLSGPAKRFFTTLASSLEPLPDEDTDLWKMVMQSGDPKYAIKFLMPRLATPQGLSWLGLCWEGLLRFGSESLPHAALSSLSFDGHLAPLMDRLRAEIAFYYADFDVAEKTLRAVDSAIWGCWPAYHLAERMLREGMEEGERLLGELARRMPWHLNLLLKAHSVQQPIKPAQEPDEEEVAILAYSWNKADLLAQTLDSLRRSHTGNARIYLLDNGSTDHMQDVFRQAGNWFGDRVETVRLPVNIGAPPARNWLLSLPGVKACTWAAFLDDDVILPENWLQQLLGAARANPRSGAVGCRITASTPPYGLQSADYNLLPIPPESGGPGEMPKRINIFDSCSGALDDGLFTYDRPCLSVSGCCHLVRQESIERTGSFDVRFNPSQFDDLERDLRSSLHDMPAYYCGSLAVQHVQHSSLAKAVTGEQMGHIMGNKFKLETKFEDAQAIRLAENDLNLLWRGFGDVLHKLDKGDG